MTLREFRKLYGITIDKAAETSGVPYRTYIRYELDDSYGNCLKRSAILEALKDKYGKLENINVLKLQNIEDVVKDSFEKYVRNIDFLYLYGSYARNEASSNSDINLMISTNLVGFKYIGLAEELESKLNKKISMIRFEDAKDELELLKNILKEGIKII